MHRLERRPVQPQADALQRVAFHLVGREARAGRASHAGDVAALVERLEPQRLALQRAPAARASAGPARSSIASPSIARTVSPARSPAARGGAAGRRLGEHRPRLRQAVHEQARVDRDREQEIEHRPGDHDREAPPDALPVEGARALRAASTGAFALVEHLDVAAERDRRDHPLGAVRADCRVSKERPKPTEKRSTFTPHRRATR